jgi:hypothetical protein
MIDQRALRRGLVTWLLVINRLELFDMFVPGADCNLRIFTRFLEREQVVCVGGDVDRQAVGRALVGSVGFLRRISPGSHQIIMRLYLLHLRQLISEVFLNLVFQVFWELVIRGAPVLVDGEELSHLGQGFALIGLHWVVVSLRPAAGDLALRADQRFI